MLTASVLYTIVFHISKLNIIIAYLHMCSNLSWSNLLIEIYSSTKAIQFHYFYRLQGHLIQHEYLWSQCLAMADSVSNYKDVSYTVVRFFDNVVHKHVSLLNKRPVPDPPLQPDIQNRMEVSLMIAETYVVQYGVKLICTSDHCHEE